MRTRLSGMVALVLAAVLLLVSGCKRVPTIPKRSGPRTGLRCAALGQVRDQVSAMCGAFYGECLAACGVSDPKQKPHCQHPACDRTVAACQVSILVKQLQREMCGCEDDEEDDRPAQPSNPARVVPAPIEGEHSAFAELDLHKPACL